MPKLSWRRDGDQHVATYQGHEAKITCWDTGIMGHMFHVYVDGRNVGGCGGGTKADALKRAKATAAHHIQEKLDQEADEEAARRAHPDGRIDRSGLTGL